MTARPLTDRVAANVRALREQQKLSLSGLAVKMAATGQPIARLGLAELENGRRRVTVDELAALAGVLGVRNPWDLTAEVCDTCLNAPPVGMRCMTCQRGARKPT